MAKKHSSKLQKPTNGFQRKFNKIFQEESNIKQKDSSGSIKERKTKKDNSCKKEEIAKKPDAEKATENSNEATDIPEKSNKTGKKPRFILFVGNLPYTVTKEALSDHFKKAGELEGVRLLMNAQKQPRGCAFVEFKSSAAMLNALLYHHTSFQDRKLNVEMTCGGGGNSAKRKKKIAEKRNKSAELIHKMLAQKKKTKSAIK
ncbi:uncharacterized protein LOC134814965 isoform X2 [Bolinopsis microptera]|uniref:uncharacterized protein LOC134814965 isoform X2 n=1 Tax=Bolinopsis microptera TaxID=2820187 RepID=UPI003078D962